VPASNSAVRAFFGQVPPKPVSGNATLTPSPVRPSAISHMARDSGAILTEHVHDLATNVKGDQFCVDGDPDGAAPELRCTPCSAISVRPPRVTRTDFFVVTRCGGGSGQPHPDQLHVGWCEIEQAFSHRNIILAIPGSLHHTGFRMLIGALQRVRKLMSQDVAQVHCSEQVLLATRRMRSGRTVMVFRPLRNGIV